MNGNMVGRYCELRKDSKQLEANLEALQHSKCVFLSKCWRQVRNTHVAPECICLPYRLACWGLLLQQRPTEVWQPACALACSAFHSEHICVCMLQVFGILAVKALPVQILLPIQCASFAVQAYPWVRPGLFASKSASLDAVHLPEECNRRADCTQAYCQYWHHKVFWWLAQFPDILAILALVAEEEGRQPVRQCMTADKMDRGPVLEEQQQASIMS